MDKDKIFDDMMRRALDSNFHVEVEEDGKLVRRVPLKDVIEDVAGNGLTKMVHLDEQGPGGAHHQYIVLKSKDIEKVVFGGRLFDDDDIVALACVNFQKGPLKEVGGVNGCTEIDLLNIIKDRLESFQAGDYACDENEQALRCLNECIDWQNKRTADREKRGVEGTNNL